MEREQIILDLIKEEGVKDIIFNHIYRLEHKEKFKKTLDCIKYFREYIDINKYKNINLCIYETKDYSLLKHMKIYEERKNMKNNKYRIFKEYTLLKYTLKYDEDYDEYYEDYKEVNYIKYISDYTIIENGKIIQKTDKSHSDETYIKKLLESINVKYIKEKKIKSYI